MKRRFVAYLWFTGWSHISLGMHVCTSLPNIEIHLPFSFIRIGWVEASEGVTYSLRGRKRGFGYDRDNCVEVDSWADIPGFTQG